MKKVKIREKEKGFTLIELLAVIVIMGILMLVAIPAISRVIENSRKDTFVDIAKSYANAARTLWAAEGLTCEGKVSSAVDDGDYYILINTKEGAREALPVLLDQGGKSSWGNRDVNGYVRVNVSTVPGEDTNGDGIYEVEPKRTTKFYVALSDGTHGLVDDGTLVSDKLVRGNVVMALSAEEKKKVELTVDDGRLDCAKDASREYLCTGVWPVKNITGICVDDQTSVGVTGRVETMGANFSTDDWSTVVAALKSGAHPYQVGDTKEVDMGTLGTHTLRIANLSTPAECSTEGFSQTACGVVLEFVDIITEYKMNDTNTNIGGYPATKLRTYINNDIYNALPTELRNAIIDTTVISGHGEYENENFISMDKLYLLSMTELCPVCGLYDAAKSSTRQLDYYENLGVTSQANIKHKSYGNNSSGFWWTRTAYNDAFKDWGHKFYRITYNYQDTKIHASESSGIAPAFRIG